MNEWTEPISAKYDQTQLKREKNVLFNNSYPQKKFYNI